MKSNKFEGLDTIFRFGQSNFFVHSNVLIIRLNFAVISENATGLITMKNPKLRSYESSHLLFKEDKDIRVFNYVILGIYFLNSHLRGYAKINIHQKVINYLY